MKSADIRESFLSFFESKGCVRRPSSSLIPDDPSLLLTSAGMVQFKPVFLGVSDLGFTRATTCQKCARTTDIDIIGTTGRHHSFFEMLGNFSFGDYFKSEACAWAYEYSTSVLGFDVDRLWFSIYEDDDEAEAIWRDEVGVRPDRIVRMGAKDNFWSAGPTGPCGPCSELYYDQGPEVGCGSPDCAPGCDCDRFLEYWNLVFMQYDRQEDGTLVPLPKKNIDTGMGLERVATILQGASSNFETDVLKAIMDEAEAVTGKTYGVAEKTDVSLRILADHARAVTFLIADGVLPSNEGRGYVLRRVLRRAVRHGRLLGVEDDFLGRLVDVVVALMGPAYPEVVEHHGLISRIVSAEEHRFGATLRQGLILLDAEVLRTQQNDDRELDGGVAFALHDTFGFPIELTAEIAAEAGLTVDMTGFEAQMTAQRERARAAVKDESWNSFGHAFSGIASTSGASDFVGYEVDETDAIVVGIVIDGQLRERLEPGERGDVILDATPFYGEQGGQVGDTGSIVAEGSVFTVEATRLPGAGIVAHAGILENEGRPMAVGQSVHAAIDHLRRERIRRNHTATHILQWALRLVLGDHVRQSGSFVSPEYLRFDFTHFEGMTPEQLAKVERMVNAKIMEDHPVRAYETSLASAREAGVTALFGEKYGDIVRVLEVGNFSKELCGGTHVARTTEIGLLKIISEGSVGASLRRIEAATSFDALEAVRTEEDVLARVADSLKCRPAEAAEKAAALQKRLRETERALAEAKRRGGTGELDGLVAQAFDAGYPVVVAEVEAADTSALREMADALRGRLPGGAVVLAAAIDGSALLLAAGSDDAVAAGFDAGALIKAIAPSVGGGGGGKPQMAQAGGKSADGIPAALEVARGMLVAR
ncbi:MAG: alanine--tRNA ligase [Coriobacteriia bacterium]|nr:alanine--tRNA ligase [Coriobacteriia bacterium]